MVESNPTVPLRSIQEQVQKRLQVGVSIHKVQRAKATSTKKVSGDYTKQYEVLRDYLMELQATNVGTTVKLEVVNESNSTRETRQFKRVYICLGALKKGFKAGLRDIMGLDSAFMKGPFPGQVLTAVGLDSNNGIYPLAYAIVETENMSSWKWFLECLGDDLELYSNSNFTFMSDRQKGLLPAIAQLYPQAEHRFCLRHIYENMRKKWKTKEYKDHLWQCAIATTIPEFEHYMNELNKFDKDAFEWLKKIPPHHWARSHFSGRTGSDILLNNLCEVFNSKLIHGRNKPIISCLEYTRQYLVKRICNVKKVMSKAPGPLTPTTSKLLERNREASVQYRARWNGTAKYEVYGPWHDQYVVDMTNMSCTCRRWELNGIPCRHAIATIHEMADSGDKVGELYTYVNKVYWLQTWNEAYSYTVDPIKGRAMWPKSTCPFQLTPPPHHNQHGRPKTKRKRSADEKYDKQMQNHGAGEPEKLTRKFVSVRCGKCNNKGHNSRTCKGQGGNAGSNEGGNAGSSQGGNA
ncbi:protein FAR1-RELATED SEQUENCE 5-like [Lactuca sativa]|nr:protein FAR1-RELATED SEQUENCE 5-like [Lactuca sativa]